MQDKLIVISAPYFFEGEAEMLNQLFEAGLTCLHLRKPESTAENIARLISQIDKRFRRRIKLHYHPDLVIEMQLGGIHFSYPKILSNLNSKDYKYTISCSLHQWQEFTEVQQGIDYCFMSPIYTSVSKADYHANEALRQVPHAVKNVFALGGITTDNCTEVLAMGYFGCVVLGYLWQDKNCTLQRFEYLQQKLKTYGK